MIKYNNQEFETFKELQEKCHLVSEHYIRLHCHCRKDFTEKVCKDNNIEKVIVIANGKECRVFSDVVIDLIDENKPQGLKAIPENYITQKELAKYLNISLGTLKDIEFWCWDFKKYKKAFTVNGVKRTCYEFTDKSKSFYDCKIYKWRHPDRTRCTCY